jgi:hypothetical protein
MITDEKFTRSLAEKIIYLPPYVIPNRTYETTKEKTSAEHSRRNGVDVPDQGSQCQALRLAASAWKNHNRLLRAARRGP